MCVCVCVCLIPINFSIALTGDDTIIISNDVVGKGLRFTNHNCNNFFIEIEVGFGKHTIRACGTIQLT